MASGASIVAMAVLAFMASDQQLDAPEQKAQAFVCVPVEQWQKVSLAVIVSVTVTMTAGVAMLAMLVVLALALANSHSCGCSL